MIDAKTLRERMVQGEALMAQAFEALRRYEAAKGVSAPNEVEQLRIRAESMFEALQLYQRRALVGEEPVIH
ncbi:hypothetical protein [Pseudomonas auratipiscis]|uniref:Uncharacterized protein n=1 Tax=Pseudomonas auratipiscis TaxID=3115853 RepID=A0AB35WWH0_9PSED|nr:MULTISPECIES: hypothetical protein [unclassified Pseudomonas]MEE1868590.1 hypothetical protein [Pseudomonas sp. 120P]MEE1959251.1 hypothetical protein [Pseudomonas sp. 119P]